MLSKELGVPYVLTFNKAEQPLTFFASKVNALRELGQKDIILDPGFGFGKTLDDNYRLLAQLETLKVLELPLLIGVSRKSMIQRVRRQSCLAQSLLYVDAVGREELLVVPLQQKAFC